ncbi:hypothetical protein ES332_D02G236600v1 [Gossypium tomentosum]|uniref:Uncharacterized protein n=1 Tax=Gossypium tomentosum TaxID=34277 RepID=A0A5D2M148_GOSTO|nr:hypothetical protein ES332_D02G236600v1 [Gossypium tomentosum]
MEVNKPLVDGFWVPRQNRNRVRASIKYEKLSDFCYFSGMLGPTAKSCKEAPLDLDENSFYFRFCPALRASFVRSEIKWEGEGEGEGVSI